MKKLFLLLALSFFLATPVFAAATIGQPAPAFTGTDTNGKTQDLQSYKGKTVVLEWTNPQCPYVRKHYETGNMQALQKAETAKGIIWLSVVSSAPGQEGNMTPDDANAYIRKTNAAATARILDSDGTIGRAYGATATPNMFVIDKAGTLVYAGAIDDRPSADHDTVKDAHNYVEAALDELAAGKPVTTSLTPAYGCGVKYGD